MQLTIPAPTEDCDLSIEAEQELIKKARISAQLAGYKSVRHFTIAALQGILQKNPLPADAPSDKSKKAK